MANGEGHNTAMTTSGRELTSSTLETRTACRRSFATKLVHRSNVAFGKSEGETK